MNGNTNEKNPKNNDSIVIITVLDKMLQFFFKTADQTSFNKYIDLRNKSANRLQSVDSGLLWLVHPNTRIYTSVHSL